MRLAREGQNRGWPQLSPWNRHWADRGSVVSTLRVPAPSKPPFLYIPAPPASHSSPAIWQGEGSRTCEIQVSVAFLPGPRPDLEEHLRGPPHQLPAAPWPPSQSQLLNRGTLTSPLRSLTPTAHVRPTGRGTGGDFHIRGLVRQTRDRGRAEGQRKEDTFMFQLLSNRISCRGKQPQ